MWKVFALYPITIEHCDQIYRGVEASEILRHYQFHESRWAKKSNPVNVLVERKTAAGAEPLLDNSEIKWEKDVKNTQLQAKLLIFLNTQANQH